MTAASAPPLRVTWASDGTVCLVLTDVLDLLAWQIGQVTDEFPDVTVLTPGEAGVVSGALQMLGSMHDVLHNALHRSEQALADGIVLAELEALLQQEPGDG